MKMMMKKDETIVRNINKNHEKRERNKRKEEGKKNQLIRCYTWDITYIILFVSHSRMQLSFSHLQLSTSSQRDEEILHSVVGHPLFLMFRINSLSPTPKYAVLHQ
jgi:hypothetical protein